MLLPNHTHSNASSHYFFVALENLQYKPIYSKIKYLMWFQSVLHIQSHTLIKQYHAYIWFISKLFLHVDPIKTITMLSQRSFSRNKQALGRVNCSNEDQTYHMWIEVHCNGSHQMENFDQSLIMLEYWEGVCGSISTLYTTFNHNIYSFTLSTMFNSLSSMCHLWLHSIYIS